MIVTLLLWFFFRPPGASAAEIILLCITIFMRNNTVAIKYAHFPLPAYRQFDNVRLSAARLLNGLVLVSWTKPSQKTVRDYLDLSMLSVGGPVRRQTKMRFLRWPETMHHAQVIARRQGLTSRTIVSYALLQGQLTAEKCPHSHNSASEVPDLKEELPQGVTLRGSTHDLEVSENPAPYVDEVALEDLFRGIVEAAVRWEEKTPIGRARGAVIPLGTLVSAILPCLGRIAGGQPFWGPTGRLPCRSCSTFLPCCSTRSRARASSMSASATCTGASSLSSR
jgi:hypothetical protein